MSPEVVNEADERAAKQAGPRLAAIVESTDDAIIFQGPRRDHSDLERYIKRAHEAGFDAVAKPVGPHELEGVIQGIGRRMAKH